MKCIKFLQVISRVCLIIVLLFSMLLSANAQIVNAPDSVPTPTSDLTPPTNSVDTNNADSLVFAARCKYVLNCFDISKVNTSSYDIRQAGYIIGAMVLKGASLADINTFAMKLSRNIPMPNQGLTGQGFNYVPLIYCYIKYNSYFADSTKQAFKNALTIQNYHDTGTYNQQITIATARYLLGQAWPDVVYADSSNFLSTDVNARKYLLSSMSSIVTKGMGEYASTPYAPFSMLSFLVLADVATDPEIKNKAIMTYETTLIQAIAASVQGVYMGATGRSYPDLYPANSYGSEQMSYIWPYTGLGGLPSAPHEAGGSNLYSYIYLMPCLANYRLPSNLYHLALNRIDGTIAKASFQGKYQYAYFNNNYGIFSQREFSTPFPQLMHSGVDWINTDTTWTKNTILWFTNPVVDNTLAVSLNHTHGISAFERIAQYLGTTVHSYNIPNIDSANGNAVYKYALGYIPGSYSAIIDNSSSGRIFLHYNKVMIAISSSNIFNCDSLTPPSTAVNGFNKPNDFMIRIYGLKFGLAIETANPTDFSGTPMQQLQAFMNQVTQNSIVYNPADSSTTYTDRFGNNIRCSSNNNLKIADSINHNLIDYSKWPTLSCPGIYETKTGNLVVTYNNQRTFYDFNNWSITNSTDSIIRFLDTLSIQPKAAYSTRLLRTAYSGPSMRVRRSSDNSQTDVYFDSTGIISLYSKIASVNGVVSDTTFCQWAGNANVFVTTWYDQTGTGFHATQSTLAYQPRILNQGVLETLDNGTPALRIINGGNGGTGFNLTYNLYGVNKFNLFISNQVDTSANLAAYHLFGSQGPTGTTAGLLQAFYSSSNSSITMTSSASALSNNKLYVTMSDFNLVRFRCTSDNNGTFLVSTFDESDSALTQSLTTPFTNAAVTLFRIGTSSYNRNFQGLSNEVIYFDTTISESTATSILQDQTSIFNINPVLNNVNQNIVLPIPTLSAANGVSNKRVNANWQSPQGTIPSGSTYTLQYSPSSDFFTGSTTIAGIPFSLFNQTMNKLTPSTQYWYRLLINANGGGYNQNEGMWSSIQSITTTPNPTTTTWNGTIWSNTTPDSSMNGIIAADLDSSNLVGTFSSCDTLTIINAVKLTINSPVTIVGQLVNNGTITGSGAMVLGDNSPQSVSGVGTINNLTLNNPSGATMLGSQSISGLLTLKSGQLAANGNLVLLSDSLGNNGMIETIDSTINKGTITGNVTVQRYISAKNARKYSFIGSPVTASIRNSWQQQIYITGTGIGGTTCGTTNGDGGTTDKYNSNGFDATQSNAASMFTYNDAPINGSRFVGIPNTENTYLIPGKGYRVNIRGNRNSTNVTCYNQLQTANPSPPESVILSATGPVTTGIFTVPLFDTTVSKYTLLANPFPSKISYTAFQANNNNYIYNKMWTYSPFGNGNYTTYSSGIIANGANGYDNTFGDRIASGQAFFVEATPAGSAKSVLFKEGHKVKTALPNTQYFGASANQALRIGLKSTTNSLLDEVVVRFNNQGSRTTYNPSWDAESFSSGSQVLKINKGSNFLSIETLPNNLTVDTAQLFIASNANGTYNLSFSDYQNIDSTTKMLLKDNYLGTSQDIRTNPIYSFNITGDTLSQGGNRFNIIFKNANSLPVNFVNIVATKNNNGVKVNWTVANQIKIASYTVERSIDGINFNSIATNIATDVKMYSIEDNHILSSLITIYYRIKAINIDGTTVYSNVAKLTTKHLPLITIYPNPLIGKTLNIQINDVKTGEYLLSIYNILGQKVTEQIIKHTGGHGTYSFVINPSLNAGNYDVFIRNLNNKQQLFQSIISVKL